jgi:sulfonate transport system ATP-binding protein
MLKLASSARLEPAHPLAREPADSEADRFAGRPTAVEVRGASRIFHDRPVLDGIDLSIRAGEFVALLGASGSGKTTLLRILAGLDAPDAGEAWVPEARTVVFQEPRLIQSKTVWRNVVIGLSRNQASRERAEAALAEVGLDHRVDAWPATLSGGEAQRAALARALVREPRLLLLDEPFAALDALTRLRMQKLIGELCHAHGPATLLVTHDVEEAILLADRVMVLREGRIAFDQRLALPEPRRASGHQFDALRTTLLAELGVHEE